MLTSRFGGLKSVIALTSRRCLATTAPATTAEAVPATTEKRAPEAKKGVLDSVGEVYIPPMAGKSWRYVPADFKEFPERDTVNYPHPNVNEWPAKVRLGVIPDSWFRFFYEKTGETGGYLFLGGFTLFLVQKELLVIDEQVARIVPNTILIYIITMLFGNKIAAKLDENGWINRRQRQNAFRDNQLETFKNTVEQSAEAQANVKVITELLYAAKRENVGLQLEAEYRRRIDTIHQAISKRLQFIGEYESVKNRFERQHMIDWIMQQVRDSITPQMQTATLNQCILDLKELSQRQ